MVSNVNLLLIHKEIEIHTKWNPDKIRVQKPMWDSHYYILHKLSFLQLLFVFFFTISIMRQSPESSSHGLWKSYLGSPQAFNMMLSHTPRLCDLLLLCQLAGHLCDMYGKRCLTFGEFLCGRNFIFTMQFLQKPFALPNYDLLLFHVVIL